jgi:Spy/CpxP family protein refolding chaperone
MNDRWTRIWFALFVLVVFVTGLAAGLLIDRSLGPAWPGTRPPRFAGGPGPMGRFPGPPPPGFLVDRLAQDLSLTADQRAKVEKIFEGRRERLGEFQSQVRARYEQEQRELRAEVEKLLTPDQRQRFQGWIERGGLGDRPPRAFEPR